jgi:hypothetical protein
VDATTATSATTATTTTTPSSSLPSFYVTRVTQTANRNAPLKPGIVGVAVPAMARHVPEREKDDLHEVRRGR